MSNQNMHYTCTLIHAMIMTWQLKEVLMHEILHTLSLNRKHNIFTGCSVDFALQTAIVKDDIVEKFYNKLGSQPGPPLHNFDNFPLWTYIVTMYKKNKVTSWN